MTEKYSDPSLDEAKKYDPTGLSVGLNTVPILATEPLPPKALERISTSTIVDIPARYRWTALAFILVYSTGAAFAEATLGPLKSTLLRELRINSE